MRYTLQFPARRTSLARSPERSETLSGHCSAGGCIQHHFMLSKSVVDIATCSCCCLMAGRCRPCVQDSGMLKTSDVRSWDTTKMLKYSMRIRYCMLMILKVCAQSIYGTSLRIGKTFRKQHVSWRSKNNQLVSIHIVRTMTMTWMQALKEYNKSKPSWCMPRWGIGGVLLIMRTSRR